jgi:virulence-associated protein VapD
MRQVLFFLAAFCLTLQSCSDATTKGKGDLNLDSSSSETPAKYTQEEKSSILEDMKKVIAGFSTENSVRDLDDTKSQLQRLGFAWYQCYGTLVEAKADSTIWKMKDTATAVLGKYQKKMFPKYRKAFAEETNKKLWIEDCSAYISGDNNEILNLVGVSFAPNRYKQESYETLQTVLKQYRFKKITFRAFKNSDDITFYDITSDEDTGYVPMDE